MKLKNKDRYIKEIKKNGYTVVKNYLSKKLIKKLLNIIKLNYNKTKFINYKGVPARDSEDKIVYNLQNKNYLFIELISNNFIIEIGKHFLNDEYYRFLPKKNANFILNYFNARSSGKKLDLHIDNFIPYKGKRTHLMQFVFLLEDSTEQNGCTIVVKGSHLSGTYTNRKSKKIKTLTGKAGDLIIWDSRLWHGTLENYLKQSRWAIVTTFSCWWIKQAMDMTASLPNSIYKKCNKYQKQLLGFCSIPPKSEFERINTKSNYNILKKNNIFPDIKN